MRSNSSVIMPNTVCIAAADSRRISAACAGGAMQDAAMTAASAVARVRFRRVESEVRIVVLLKG